MLTFKEFIAESDVVVPSSSTTTSSIAITPDGFAMGHPFFRVDPHTFHKAIQSKNRYHKWNDYLSQNKTVANKIRAYKKANPTHKIMLQNSSSKEFSFTN